MFARFLLCLSLLVTACAPQTTEGTLRVIDGDTVALGATRIRLFGVDAPEIGQQCFDQGRSLDCGALVRDAMKSRFAGSRAVCHRRDTDQYGRDVAVCFVDDQDIGKWLVQEGLAFAYRRYSDVYLADERWAAARERGLWAMQIAAPWDYRASQAAARPDPSCRIKGNITGDRRIYHLPGQRYYAQTRISTREGERWFCSTDEARAAGWRPSRI
ncbi:MAG: thermonuclease family protein [Yoonia sp.]|uniref:thermonuclease family protein n=1 Tax=Yoonia sp. TaxID=2212373 RepID=UPI003EF5123D